MKGVVSLCVNFCGEGDKVWMWIELMLYMCIVDVEVVWRFVVM